MMTWFRLWSEDGRNFAQIAEATKPTVTRQSVRDAVLKTAEWIRLQEYDTVLLIRTRHTKALEKIVCIGFEKFFETQIKRTITEDGGGPPDEDGEVGTKYSRKTEESTEDVGYLRLAMDAQRDIRKIWGSEAPTKSEVEQRHAEEIPELPMMNGYPSRAAYLRDVAKAINGIADRAAK